MTNRLHREGMDENPKALYDEGWPPPLDLANATQQSACTDCDRTVHLAWVDHSWRVTTFHETTCPALARLRADPNPNAGNAFAKGAERRLAALGFKVGFGELRDYLPDEDGGPA